MTLTGKKEFVIINGVMIEIVMKETVDGDYVASANFRGKQSVQICRHKDPQIAFFTCIDRLIKL